MLCIYFSQFCPILSIVLLKPGVLSNVNAGLYALFSVYCENLILVI